LREATSLAESRCSRSARRAIATKMALRLLDPLLRLDELVLTCLELRSQTSLAFNDPVDLPCS
jgi:hypothetical protein